MTVVKLPPTVVLELTYRCNHRCKFCSCPWDAPNNKFQKGKELTTTEWFAAIDRLYDLGIQSFSLSGGEAILRNDIRQIIEHIRTEGLSRNIDNPMVLISNGLAMNDELLDVFAMNRVHLSMSLPGYSTFEWHTGINNADGVLSWFQKAKAKGVHTTAGITVTKRNYDELYETMALALINGAEMILLNRFLPGGRGLTYRHELELNRKQLQKMLETAEEVLNKSNRYGNIGTEYPYCLIDDIDKYNHLGIGTKCAAASTFFVVGPAGEIRVCNHSQEVVGNIKNKNIVDNISYWNVFAEEQYIPNECESCQFVKKCACGCREVAHIVNGSPLKLDPCVNK